MVTFCVVAQFHQSGGSYHGGTTIRSIHLLLYKQTVLQLTLSSTFLSLLLESSDFDPSFQ